MNQRLSITCAGVLVGAIALFSTGLALCQEATQDDRSDVSTEQVLPPLTAEDVTSSMAELEKDASIDEAEQKTLQTRYQQVIDLLQDAEDFASKTIEYQASLETAPKENRENLERLDALPAIEAVAKMDIGGGAEQVRQELDARHATREELSDELLRVTKKLSEIANRPVDIASRLPEAQRELSAIQSRWESVDPAVATPRARVDRFLLQAEYARLANEIEMLRQEQLSHSPREQELTSRQNLLTREVENTQAVIDQLTAVLEQRLTSEVNRIRTIAQEASQGLPDDAAVQALAVEVQEFAEQYETAVENFKLVTPAIQEVKDRFEDVSGDYRDVRRELTLGGGGRELAQVLLELSRRARPTALERQMPISVERARLDLFSTKRRVRGQSVLNDQFGDHPAEAGQLIDARREILDALQTEGTNLTQALAELQTQRQKYFTRISHLTSHTLARDLRQTLEKQGFGPFICQADRGTQWVTRKTMICGLVLTAV